MLPRKVYSLKQKLIEAARRGKRGASVFMFHEVYGPGETPIYPELAVSAERFARFLDTLEREHVVTPARVAEPGAVLLTFDDPFFCAFVHAVPAMRARQLPYTMFVAPGLLGQPGYLTTQQLRALAEDPLCTIGAHSMNHPLMRALPEEAALAELRESKQWLEKFCGREVSYFAFPYGSVFACSPANVRQVTACGYRCGFSTINSDVLEQDLQAPYFLPRLAMSDAILMKRGL